MMMMMVERWRLVFTCVRSRPWLLSGPPRALSRASSSSPSSSSPSAANSSSASASAATTTSRPRNVAPASSSDIRSMGTLATVGSTDSVPPPHQLGRVSSPDARSTSPAAATQYVGRPPSLQLPATSATPSVIVDTPVMRHRKKPFCPTDEQLRVFELIRDPQKRVIVVDSRAGSGKTTTLINCLPFIPRDKNVLVLSFGKANADELGRRLHAMRDDDVIPDNTKACTFHALGLSSWIRHRRFVSHAMRSRTFSYASGRFILNLDPNGDAETHNVVPEKTSQIAHFNIHKDINGGKGVWSKMVRDDVPYISKMIHFAKLHGMIPSLQHEDIELNHHQHQSKLRDTIKSMRSIDSSCSWYHLARLYDLRLPNTEMKLALNLTLWHSIQWSLLDQIRSGANGSLGGPRRCHSSSPHSHSTHSWIPHGLPLGPAAAKIRKSSHMFDFAATMDFEDMIYMPSVTTAVKLHCSNERPWDYVFIDEAQDLSAVRTALVSKTVDKNTKLILFGDINQNIYQWAGCTSNLFQRAIDVVSDPSQHHTIFPHMELSPGSVVAAPLTVTQRCPNTIVKTANEIVDDLKARDDASEGEVKRIESHELIADIARSYKSGDVLVIARYNCDVVNCAFACLDAGMPAKVPGRGVGYRLPHFFNHYFLGGAKKIERGVGSPHVDCWEEFDVKDRLVDALPRMVAFRWWLKHAVSEQELSLVEDSGQKGVSEDVPDESSNLEDKDGPAVMPLNISLDYVHNVDQELTQFFDRFESVILVARLLFREALRDGRTTADITVENLYDRLTQFDIVDDERPKVTVTTIHRARGLEAPVVYMLTKRSLDLEIKISKERIKENEQRRKESPSASPETFSDWFPQSEINVLYVGITRSMRRLILSSYDDTVGHRSAHRGGKARNCRPYITGKEKGSGEGKDVLWVDTYSGERAVICEVPKRNDRVWLLEMDGTERANLAEWVIKRLAEERRFADQIIN